MEQPRPTEQERLENLRRRIETAMANPIDEEDMDSLRQAEDKATNKFIRGESDLQEYLGELPETRDSRGTVTFGNLGDFISAVKLVGFRGEVYQNIVWHENEHMNEAVQKGIKAEYKITFIRGKNGQPTMRATTSLHLSQDSNIDSPSLKNIVAAPGEENLSPTDRAKLEGI